MIIFKTDLEEIPPCCELCPYSRPYGLVGDRLCKVTGVYFTGNVKPPYKEKPNECPLKPLPTKIEVFRDDWSDGYNACLEDILGE